MIKMFCRIRIRSFGKNRSGDGRKNALTKENHEFQDFQLSFLLC